MKSFYKISNVNSKITLVAKEIGNIKKTKKGPKLLEIMRIEQLKLERVPR